MANLSSGMMAPLKRFGRFLRSALVLQMAFAAVAAVSVTCLRDRPAEYSYAFEVKVALPVEGRVQVYYDRGAGLSEHDSTFEIVPAGTHTLRLRLPEGSFNLLRFDPLTSDAPVSFGGVRIVGPGGWTVQRLDVDAFQANDQVERTETIDGVRHVISKPGVNDPQFAINFDPRLRLTYGFVQRLSAAPATLILWFVGTLLVLVVVSRLWRSPWLVRLHGWCAGHPRRAIALCAVAAGLLSSYPVVFCGMSFIAPSSGIRLLYDGTITVPKQTDTRIADARGSDIGAFHWAHQPYTVLQRRALQEGTLPLWNRYNLCGVTLLGQGQSMFGDPINFLVMLAGADALAFDIKFVLCKVLFAFGIGLAVWMVTRDLGAAILLTFGAAFIGFYNYRVNHPAIFSLSYSPWVLVGWLTLLRATNGRELARALALWFVANWALITSGTAKEAYLLCAALNGTGGLMLLLAPVPFGVKIRRAIPIAIAGVAFVLASVPLWWTFLDALGRAQTFYDAPIAHQAPRTWLVGLFDDVFYMESLPGRALYIPGSNFLILLGCAWALVPLRRLARDRLALSLLLGLLAAISVGFAWMPASWIVATPFLRNVHHLGNHFSCIAIVHAAILAGWGFSAARHSAAAGRVIPHVIGAVLVVGGLLTAYFRENPALWSGGRGLAGCRELWAVHSDFYAYVLLLVIALGVFAAVVLSCVRRQSVTGFKATLAAVALAALLGRHTPHLPFGLSSRFIYLPGERSELFTPSPTTEFVRDATKSEPARVVGTVNAMFTGFIAVHGLESHTGPDAIFSPRYRELLLTAQMVQPHDWRSVFVPPTLPAWRPFLDFLNVGYIAATPQTVPDGSRFRRVAQLDLDVLRGETTWPRAFFVDRLERYHTVDQLVSRIRQQPPGQPFAAVQAGDADAPATAAPLNREAVMAPATDYQLSTNTTAFTLVAPGPGFAILHESWSKEDFRVTANGKPVPFFRVNHVFKGIALEAAGTYRIEFAYWPRHFTRSLLLGGTGFLLIAGVLVMVFRRASLSPVFGFGSDAELLQAQLSPAREPQLPVR